MLSRSAMIAPDRARARHVRPIKRRRHMGEILGLGCTHYPGLLGADDKLPGLFHHLLTAPNVPEHYKQPKNWPAELLAELGNDAGQAAAVRYGERMANGFRAVRKALDACNPDFVLVGGDH